MTFNKLIRAVVRPDTVELVKAALDAIGVRGMTIVEVSGHGRQSGQPVVYRGQEFPQPLRPRMEIDVVVSDDRVEDVISAIMKAARTGVVGDGRVFVLPVTEAYQIRTGERT